MHYSEKNMKVLSTPLLLHKGNKTCKGPNHKILVVLTWTYQCKIFFCLLLILQQNIVNKSCREYLLRHLVVMQFFLQAQGEKSVFRPFTKAYTSYNIHVGGVRYRCTYRCKIFFGLLLILQQNILNKSCREYFLRHLIIMWFFLQAYKFQAQREKPVFRPFAKAYTSYNIHVRHFAFWQCIVYAVIYERTECFLKKLFLKFYIIKKKIFAEKSKNPFVLLQRHYFLTECNLFHHSM